jgi:two-component system chemotaxis sensor kinase CheA
VDAEATWTVQERTLMTAGFDPLVCTDGADAFQAIAAQNSDLVVLALGLPEADGWAILGRLRAEPRTSRLPVLIVTARDDAETLQRARPAGANGFLSESFDVDKFRNMVNELVVVS